MDNILHIQLKFIEPYRLVEFIDKNGEKESRGLTFAQWQERKDKKGWVPVITGTLVRSAAIRAAEEILNINKGVWDNEECCNGYFKSDDKHRNRPLRKRHTLKWSDKDACGECPFCIFLKTKDSDGNLIIHFRNLFIDNRKTCFNEKYYPQDYLKEIASNRVLNRIDPKTGKAFDYFRLWEVEDEDFWNFSGRIEIATESEYFPLELLRYSLSFIDHLCGALCVVSVVSSLQTSFKNGAGYSPEASASKGDKTPSFDASALLTKKIKEIALDINTVFEKTNNTDSLRTVSEAIKRLRLIDPASVNDLPKGRDKDGHYIWDKIKYDEKSTRKILENAITNDEIRLNWRKFCELLGQYLYGYYKDKRGGIITRERLLGDTMYYSKQGMAGDIIRVDGRDVLKEWIFVGRLKAETPFFFGTEAKGGDLTTIQILLDKKTGRYRIPRSVLRGILRNDLRFAFGTGCVVELGGMYPCDCPVCKVMRKITITDSQSGFSEPPEVRQRIRMNPQTGTVEEGALFDIEVGPEGVTFPFVLRYRGDEENLPSELIDVIHIWRNGQAFLGGSSSTCKGRFILELEHLFEWQITKDTLENYIDNHGFRGEESNISSKVDSIAGLTEKSLPNKSANFKEQWQKVKYTIKIKSPLLSADPIGALLDSGNYDSVVFEKRIVKDGHLLSYVPAYKGEAIRGIIRTGVGRQYGAFDEGHKEDCICEICRIFYRIFGSVHEASRIRFEDLSIEYNNKKKLDHVAIDRFMSGAAENKKFDDYPIEGNSDSHIILRGQFWKRCDLSADDFQKIVDALCDIRDGLYPLGGKGGIGYGWVEDVEIFLSSGFTLPIKNIINDDEKKSEVTFDYPSLPQLNLDKDAIYFPHYFLKPYEKEIKEEREIKLIGHEKFQEGHLTGKIECILTTHTPLIIPDTENDAYKLRTSKGDLHPSFRFFRIDGKEMIPGSEIRGPVSSVYESLTNSCFRILEESRYISWRMKPEEFVENPKKSIKGYRPGMVEIDEKNPKNLKIFEVKKAYRLPLYDDETVTNTIQFNDYENNFKGIIRGNKRLEKAISANNKIAEAATKNLEFLRKLRDEKPNEFNEVVLGKKPVKFREDCVTSVTNKEKNETTCIDCIAILGEGDNEGIIKFTGLNNANIANKKGEADKDFKDEWDIWKLNILLESKPQCRKSKEQPYPRPCLIFTKNEKEYTVTKRCERIFYSEPNKTGGYEIPKNVHKQYKAILKEYQQNREKVEKNFQTLIHHDDLKHGDLVYFHLDRDDKVDAVIPVCISRKSAKKPLGKELPDDFLRPCEREVLEDIDAELLSRLPDKMLLRRHKDGLCPACRLFGTTTYKGRVRFGFAEIIGEPKWLMDEDENGNRILTLPLLEKPRPTWSMPKETPNVPGRKFYVHHNRWKRIKENSDEETLEETLTENNRTVEPLDGGNGFKFEVFFENLKPWELGLLIYSIELQDGLAHKIGMAKPFGFGSVKIDVKDVLLRDGPNVWSEAIAFKKEWLKKGFEKLEDWFGNELSNVQHIKNLMRLLRYQDRDDIKVEYPKLKKEDPEDTNEKIPGYVELKDIEVWSDAKRQELLIIPWYPWHENQPDSATPEVNAK